MYEKRFGIMDKAEENIIQRDIENEMRTAYIDYAMSVIVARASSRR